MAVQITVPRLGWTMEEGTFVGWLKKEGESVRPGDPLFTLDGDKALQEIEATENGILHIPPGAPNPGSTVRVGDLLGYLVAEEECSISAKPLPAVPKRVETSPETAQMSSPAERVAAPQAVSAEPRPSHRAVTPRALRAANRLGADWNSLIGTGHGGRIRERDVLAGALLLLGKNAPDDPPRRARETEGWSHSGERHSRRRG